MKTAYELQLAVEILLLEKCPVELDEATLHNLSFEIVRLFSIQNQTIPPFSRPSAEIQCVCGAKIKLTFKDMETKVDNLTITMGYKDFKRMVAELGDQPGYKVFCACGQYVGVTAKNTIFLDEPTAAERQQRRKG